MKKVLLALVLGLTALSSFATQYISQCAMCYAGSVDEAYQKLQNAGYTPIGGDLNDTAGGKYVWIGAKYTTDPNQAITGFAVYNSDLSGAADRPNTFSRGGVTYYKIGSGCVDWCPNVVDGAVDLTMGARGDDMNMYATRDFHAGPPVTDWCQACKSKSDDAKNIINAGGFTPVYDQNGDWADCNKDTCDWYIYVGYKIVRSDAYRYPEYRTAGTPTSGIKEWKTGSAAAAPIRNNETTWNAGWHVVECDLTISSRITCNGDVRLILADGCKLTAVSGVTVSGGNSLTIYGQTAGTGTLVANGSQYAAGIGGDSMGSGQNITINGGTVTATGGTGGAGIGGGDSGAGRNITINGGIVTATGGAVGSGVGGGCMQAGENITINGGHVMATGVGGSYEGSSSNIRVDTSLLVMADGAAIANDGGDLAAKLKDKRGVEVWVGGAVTLKAGVPEVVDMSPSVAWAGKTVTIAAKAGYSGALGLPIVRRTDDPSATVAVTTVEPGWRYTFTMPDCSVTVQPSLLSRPVSCLRPVYRDGVAAKGVERWETMTAEYHQDVTADVTAWGTAGCTTWYVVSGDVTNSSRITCNGAVNLILKEGCTLTASQGITVTGGNSLTIYGQGDGTGTLVANGSPYAAGIGGGGKDEVGQNITINGGIVTAKGGSQPVLDGLLAFNGGAGIGGGYGSLGQNITVNGGIVTATGGADAAGIGGGDFGDGQGITINGGEVTAKGDHYGAGIGGGYHHAGKNITVNGGMVTATTGGTGAGIGGGEYGDGQNITINGGTVTATTGGYATSGIGGGRDGSASNVKVDPSALIVKANGAVVANDGGDLSAALRDKSFVVIVPSTVSVGDGLAATFAAGVCTISGEGAMSEHAPLMGDDSADGMLELCRNDIRSLVIGNGVTSVAPERFNAFPALTNVTIAASVARIGAGAFANCSALESITFLGDTLPTIEEGALDVRVSIELVDGIPVVSSTPYVTVGERAPRLMGAKSLVNPIRWEQVEAGKESEYKFFRVEIE